jgi:glycosyltransferase involved in cell wall biosynthesis
LKQTAQLGALSTTNIITFFLFQWYDITKLGPGVDFVLLIVQEGLPNVLLEAMACALPCVVSDLPSVTYWLIDDGVTDVLFHSDDPDVLIRKISPHFAEHGIQQRIGLAARHFMEINFSGASTSQKLLNLYRSTIGQTFLRIGSS